MGLMDKLNQAAEQANAQKAAQAEVKAGRADRDASPGQQWEYKVVHARES